MINNILFKIQSKLFHFKQIIPLFFLYLPKKQITFHIGWVKNRSLCQDHVSYCSQVIHDEPFAMIRFPRSQNNNRTMPFFKKNIYCCHFYVRALSLHFRLLGWGEAFTDISRSSFNWRKPSGESYRTKLPPAFIKDNANRFTFSISSTILHLLEQYPQPEYIFWSCTQQHTVPT